MDKREVGFVVFPGLEILDLAGPAEVFAATRAFDPFTIGLTPEAILAQGFVTILPERTFDNCPVPHVLVIPGGDIEPAASNPDFLAWIARAAKEAEIVMSVCTGAFVLAHAGVLDGLAATTWHGRIERLRAQAPRTKVLDHVRIVDNGRVITTAGVSAGIDGALHVVDRLLGREAAERAAAYMEYAWAARPPYLAPRP